MRSAELRPAWQMPVQWPQPVAAPTGVGTRDAERAERLFKSAVVVALLALTVFDRFGIRVTSDFSIPPGVMALYVLVAVAALNGVLQMNVRGALAYLAATTVGAASYVVNAWFSPSAQVSLGSLLLFFIFYAPFTVAFRLGPRGPALWRWTLEAYVVFALLLALAGIAQFFGQFFTHAEWLFDYTPMIPEGLRTSGGWNTVYTFGPWIKSNGFFLREASMLSIAAAFAILCELSLERRKWVIAILAFAMLLSYSGAGLVCLALGLMFPLGRGAILRLLACVAIGATVFVVLGKALNLSYTIDRIGEINDERSSAYCRFVYPGAAAFHELTANPWSTLVGNGPGSMTRMGGTCPDGHQTTYAKVVFEYGLLGTLAIGALVLGALSRAGAPARIGVAVGATWLLLGGNLIASELLLVMFLFSAMWPERTAAEALEPQARAP